MEPSTSFQEQSPTPEESSTFVQIPLKFCIWKVSFLPLIFVFIDYWVSVQHKEETTRLHNVLASVARLSDEISECEKSDCKDIFLHSNIKKPARELMWLWRRRLIIIDDEKAHECVVVVCQTCLQVFFFYMCVWLKSWLLSEYPAEQLLSLVIKINKSRFMWKTTACLVSFMFYLRL